MSRSHPFVRRVQIVTAFLLLVACPGSLAQTADQNPLSALLPPVLKFDMSERINPWDPQKKARFDRFRLTFAGKNLALNYSSLAPSSAAGRQFLALPGGYNLIEFSWKKRWGTLSGFRSTDFNPRIVPFSLARTVTGAVVEVPKTQFGTRVAGYVVHGSDAGIRETNSAVAGQPSGTQVGLQLERDFKKRLNFQSEWTQSKQALAGGTGSGFGRGLFLRVSGKVAKSDAGFTFRSQGEHFANPLLPAQGRGRSIATLDVRRTFKKHQLQFSRQSDSQAAMRLLNAPYSDLQQESLRWTYNPKLLPQVSAARTWMRQQSPGKQESEDNLRLAFNKSLKRVTLGMAYLRGMRVSHFAFQPLWEKTGFSGDAIVEVRKNRRLSFHYESSELIMPATSQLISTEILQSNTRFSWWADKISLVPAVDYRRQESGKGTGYLSWLDLVLSALVKLPRYLPGSDLLITMTARRLETMGRPDQNSAGLVFLWNFKRL